MVVTKAKNIVLSSLSHTVPNLLMALAFTIASLENTMHKFLIFISKSWTRDIKLTTKINSIAGNKQTLNYILIV
jgi:hypothetical protein